MCGSSEREVRQVSEAFAVLRGLSPIAHGPSLSARRVTAKKIWKGRSFPVTGTGTALKPVNSSVREGSRESLLIVWLQLRVTKCPYGSRTLEPCSSRYGRHACNHEHLSRLWLQYRHLGNDFKEPSLSCLCAKHGRGSTHLRQTSPSDWEVAQLGRALGLGPRCRRFESCLPDYVLKCAY